MTESFLLGMGKGWSGWEASPDADQGLPEVGTGYHSRDLRKGRFSQVGATYAVTKCTANRARVFDPWQETGRLSAQVVVDEFRNRHGTGEWLCLGYVVMPDHLHLVIRLLKGSLSGQMGAFSRFTAREIHRVLGQTGTLWQEGFYDHALRGRKSCEAYLQYIRFNPVRAGLVGKPEEWAYMDILPGW